jgi:membrane protease YdiL (CAAX protease family)
MTEEPGGPLPDVPDHPEPDPRLRGFPPPPGYPGPAPAYGITPYPTGPSGPAPYAPPPPPVPVRALPLEPRRYSQLLRGPRYRWWKPLLALALGSALVLGFSFITVVPPLLVGLVTGVPDLGSYLFTTLTDVDNLGPVGFVALNLSLIILIPAVVLSIWIVHGVRPRFVSSVTGGIRWRWMLTCLVIVVPVWVLYIGLGVLVDPTAGPRPAHWVALLVIVVLTTPLQAAGEEYFFRGWIMQNVGAWFARPLVGLVVTTAVSTVLFSLAHGSLDLWVLGNIGCFAVAACLATWRTGGLEAGIAMHAVNNILAFFVAIVLGGWTNVFVGADTKGTVVQFLLSVLVHGVALALIWWQAGRQDLPYLSRPPLPTSPAQLEGPVPWQPAAPAGQKP